MKFQLKVKSRLADCPVQKGDLIIFTNKDSSDGREGFVVTRIDLTSKEYSKEHTYVYGKALRGLTGELFLFPLYNYEKLMTNDIIRHFRNNEQIFI